jgi:hypothetical protein
MIVMLQLAAASSLVDLDHAGGFELDRPTIAAVPPLYRPLICMLVFRA